SHRLASPFPAEAILFQKNSPCMNWFPPRRCARTDSFPALVRPIAIDRRSGSPKAERLESRAILRKKEQASTLRCFRHTAFHTPGELRCLPDEMQTRSRICFSPNRSELASRACQTGRTRQFAAAPLCPELLHENFRPRDNTPPEVLIRSSQASARPPSTCRRLAGKSPDAKAR